MTKYTELFGVKNTIMQFKYLINILLKEMLLQSMVET